MLDQTGIPAKEDLSTKIPPVERLEKGPVAIIECFRPIPCDPCYHSCPFGAIKEFNDINDIPELDYAKCTGCGNCVPRCPGLAIFVVDVSYSEEEALVILPYEFLPLPEEGDKVIALDRAGKKVARARVEKVKQPTSFDKTAVVTLAVPRGLEMEVRNFRSGGGKDEEG